MTPINKETPPPDDGTLLLVTTTLYMRLLGTQWQRRDATGWIDCEAPEGSWRVADGEGDAR